MKILTTTLAAALLMSTSVMAESAPAGGPTIDGGVKIDLNADANIAAGIGNESKAAQELGNINDGNISGGVDEVENYTGNIAAGIGNKSCASQKIGSIGGKGDDC